MRVLILGLLLASWAAALEPEQADPQRLREVLAERFSGGGYALAELVAWQRRSYPQALVTSGFYDTRGVSRYRSAPGLHLGYDIAMPAGATVQAAWAGTVVAVVPWAPGEWGVVVRHPDGVQATYGHIAPLVAVGAAVTSGDRLGSVAVDHVDVKLRDAAGAPLDYGQSQARPPSREQLLARWWLARLEREAALRKSAGARRQLELLERRERALPRALELGLWSPAQIRQLHADLRRLRSQPSIRGPWEQTERQALRAGLNWEEVRRLAREWAERYPGLQGKGKGA